MLLALSSCVYSWLSRHVDCFPAEQHRRISSSVSPSPTWVFNLCYVNLDSPSRTSTDKWQLTCKLTPANTAKSKADNVAPSLTTCRSSIWRINDDVAVICIGDATKPKCPYFPDNEKSFEKYINHICHGNGRLAFLADVSYIVFIRKHGRDHRGLERVHRNIKSPLWALDSSPIPITIAHFVCSLRLHFDQVQYSDAGTSIAACSSNI